MRMVKALLLALALLATSLQFAPSASARSNYCFDKELFVNFYTGTSDGTGARMYDFYNRLCYDVSEETEWPTGQTDARLIPPHATHVQVVFNKITTAQTVSIHLEGMGLNGNYTATKTGFFGCCSHYATGLIEVAPAQQGVLRASTTADRYYSVCHHAPGASCV